MVISGNWLIILQLQGNALLSAGPVPIALGRDARYITRARGSFLARTGYALSREAVTLSDNGKNQCDERILAGRPTQGFRCRQGVRSVARFESRVKDGNFANRLLFTKRICLICNPAADLLEPTNLPFIFIRQKRCLSRA